LGEAEGGVEGKGGLEVGDGDVNEDQTGCHCEFCLTSFA
jgi:hypothetical protein